VLSIGKLGAGAEEYYLGTIARGVEEYYSDAGEVPGRWVGIGAHHLSLTGEVSGDDLRALLGGRQPSSGELLSSRPRRIPGFDLTFSAPKSASLLFAFGGGWVAKEVVAAQEASVDAALGYLEREACMVRRGHAGAFQMTGAGFAGAAFRHRTSRAGDPQLHTHVLVANLAVGTDGEWSALDARLLYRQARTAGYLYQAHLRHELSTRLGVSWQPAARGMAEIDGMDAAALRGFSQRRVEVEDAMKLHSGSGRRAAQIAALATRRSKATPVDDATLRREWGRRAIALGLSPRGITRVAGGPARIVPLTISDHGAVAATVTANESTFDRRAALRATAERCRDGAPLGEIERQADEFLASPGVIQLRHGHYTTTEMISIEQRIITGAVGQLRRGLGVVPVPIVKSALAAAPELSEEQRAMVRLVTRSGNGVDLVVGAPGSGKTRALDAAHDAWRESGYHVLGVALAARAAQELQTQTEIPSTSIDALLSSIERGQGALPPSSVMVVDEAGMVGTRKLDRLLHHAQASGAKVVLVGDHHQLPEIAAGGAFAGLAARLPAIRLEENRRQRDGIERAAIAELREGRTALAVELLAGHGRVTTTPNRHDAHAAVVQAWLRSHHAREDSVMLAGRKADVTELNRQARAALVDAGTVSAQGIEVRGREFGVGDRVLTLSNWHQRGIVNGARGTVTEVGNESVTIQFDNGQSQALPPTYLRAGHLSHAYAMTIHKAQGMTVDRSFVLADDSLFRESGYTALSRGRLENHIVVVAAERAHDDIGHGPAEPPGDLTESLIKALTTSHAKEMAIDGCSPSIESEAVSLDLDLSL